MGINFWTILKQLFVYLFWPRIHVLCKFYQNLSSRLYSSLEKMTYAHSKDTCLKGLSCLYGQRMTCAGYHINTPASRQLRWDDCQLSQSKEDIFFTLCSCPAPALLGELCGSRIISWGLWLIKVSSGQDQFGFRFRSQTFSNKNPLEKTFITVITSQWSMNECCYTGVSTG